MKITEEAGIRVPGMCSEEKKPSLFEPFFLFIFFSGASSAAAWIWGKIVGLEGESKTHANENVKTLLHSRLPLLLRQRRGCAADPGPPGSPPRKRPRPEGAVVVVAAAVAAAARWWSPRPRPTRRWATAAARGGPQACGSPGGTP